MLVCNGQRDGMSRLNPGIKTMTETEEFNELLEDHLDDAKQAAIALFNEQIELCESPIERALFPHLMFLRPGWLCCRYGGPLDYGIEMRLEPQKVIGGYRVDFGLRVRPIWQERDELKLAIECDGHQFHERTKEQAARDKERTRALFAAGWVVVPFTGRQITTSPAKCAGQIADIVNKHFGDKVVEQVYESWSRRG